MSNRKSAKLDPIDPKPNSNSSWVLLDGWAGLGWAFGLRVRFVDFRSFSQ